MKSFKYLIFILVIFFKTGTFCLKVHYLMLIMLCFSNLSANNQFFVNEAIKKGLMS